MVAVGAMAVLGVAGCGDDDDGGGGAGGDGGGGASVDAEESALVEPFDAAAEAAYTAAGSDRSEDFTRGVVVEEGCFVLSDEGVVAVAEALGVDGAADAEITEGTYLSGPPGQRENLTCSLYVGDDEVTVGIHTGTTQLDRDELLEEFELYAGRDDLELEVLQGEAPGLDPDEVFAVDRDGFVTVGWIQGDFQISMSIPEQVADADAGFQALPVLVAEVTETLSG